MAHPSSEREAHAWLTHASATLELLRLEGAQPLSLSKLYRTFDLLRKHRQTLETALAQRERSLLVLYLSRPDLAIFSAFFVTAQVLFSYRSPSRLDE